jgi:hypothetical protein
MAVHQGPGGIELQGEPAFHTNQLPRLRGDKVIKFVLD